jgi:hypothetical protein
MAFDYNAIVDDEKAFDIYPESVDAYAAALLRAHVAQPSLGEYSCTPTSTPDSGDHGTR